MSDKRVIGLVGMPGSGKSIIDDVAKELGFSVVIMGDVIREEAKRRGMDPSPENIGKVMLDMRAQEGPAVVAKRCILKILDSLGRVVVVEGIRSYDEVEEFRKAFPDFTLIAVHSSPTTRFERTFRRRRSDDPANWQIFCERDLRELNVGIGAAIAMADHVIVNEDTPTQLRREAQQLLRRLESSASRRPAPS